MPGKILLAVVRREAEIQAERPTARPAEISVPVSTMQPAMPSAMGSFAAVSEMMLTMEDSDTNWGTRMAIKMIASTITIYMALLNSRSVMVRRLS